MILNIQQDNTIEGDYLKIENSNPGQELVEINLPENFLIDTTNDSAWVIGWGDEKPYYDEGSENLRDFKLVGGNKIRLGRSLRGGGFPKKGQPVVFWNRSPSLFTNRLKKPIIDPSLWPEFAGTSVHFGGVAFDSTMKKWIMILNECDTSKIQIYAAASDNLVDWVAANDGNPILTADDFKDCIWAGRDKANKVFQAPFISDLFRYNGIWYLFLDGYSIDGKRHIGIAKSHESLLGPFEISRDPILSPGSAGSWDDDACFYPKVKIYHNGFIMFYDGRNTEGVEGVGMAESKDLTKWTAASFNPVLSQHRGWRSDKGTAEPAWIGIKNDSIFLLAAGKKEFNTGFWEHYITQKMYMDKSGNVGDSQLGLFSSVDSGRSFVAHKNNPVFTNDFANKYENDHMGANFAFVKTDTVEYIFYQAKSDFKGLRYNIMLREKRIQ